MPGPNWPYPPYDGSQVLQQCYNASEDRIRVDAEVTATIGVVEVIINQSTDNIAIGDGTTLFTGTTVGGHHGLDVNVIDFPAVQTIQGTNSDGSVNVNVVSSSVSVLPGLSISYNEVTSVSSGIETTIISIVAPVSGYRVNKIEVSGTNVAQFKVKVNGSIVSTKRTWWTQFNETFNYETFSEGLLLSSGQTLTVTALHNSSSLGDFETTVMAAS